MPQTTKHELRYPAGSDTRNVPRDLRYLADDVDRELEELVAMLGNVSGALAGTLAARPAATAKLNTLYVATDSPNTGRAWLSVGTAQSASWVELAVNLRLARVQADAATDVPLQVRGAASQSADLLQFLTSGGSLRLRYGIGSSPNLTAPAAAADHVPLRVQGAASQTADLLQATDSSGAVLFRISAKGRLVRPPVATTNYAYNADGTIDTMTELDGSGATLSSTKFNYTGGNLTSTVRTGDGRTLTTTFTYTNGNLTSQTEAAS